MSNSSPNAHYRSVFQPGLFSGQLVWVTGGGSGIGRCVAHELAALGAKVVISGRTQTKLDAVAEEITTDGGQCVAADFRNGMPGMGHSGAARAGMANLTATAAFEWAHAGVRVNAVAPGWIASSGMDTYGGAMKSLIPKLKQHVPLRRMGEESEVSAAIVFLL